MGDESLIITIVGAVVTTIISTVVLRSLKFFEKKQETKAQEMKETAAQAAEQARINAVKIAEEIMKRQEERSNAHLHSTAQIANEIKSETQKRDEFIAQSLKDNAERMRIQQMQDAEKIAKEFAVNTAKIADELRQKTDQQSKDILDKITDVNTRLSEMIDSLQQGAEATNSNVANVRRDMLELQEDVDNIYDKINKEDIDKDPDAKAERDRKRKIRRREINNDSLIYDAAIKRINKGT
jgi:D-ribose pyranose/furanose isomerase RbsD